MRVLVVLNPSAGDGDTGEAQTRQAIEAAGHDCDMVTPQLDDDADDPFDWTAAVDDHELVVISGGDGTVRPVLTGLAAHTCLVPVTVLATGTANNIARTLGIPTDDPLSWIAGWAEADRIAFHLPRVRGAGIDRLCVEGVGVGLLAELVDVADRREAHADDEVDPLAIAREVFDQARPAPIETTLDGVDLTAELFGVHAMNVREAGPNLSLAPDAEVDDGNIDVVLLTDGDRHAVIDHAETDDGSPPPPTTVRRGRVARITVSTAGPALVDDQLVRLAAGDTLEVSGGRAAVTMLVPANAELAGANLRIGP